MFNKNSILRAIAVIGIITLLSLTVLPGCSFVGKADIPEETTTDPFALDTGLTQGCPMCQSLNITGPDDKGFFTCGDCGAQWGTTTEGGLEVYDKDGNPVTPPDSSAGLGSPEAIFSAASAHSRIGRPILSALR